MSKQINRCFVHFVWSTRRRAALLSPDDDDFVSRALRAQCVRLGCTPLAVGVNDDHVHVLVMLGFDASLSKIVSAMKGASAYLFNRGHRDRRLEWQAGWAAFTVCDAHVDAVVRYVREQRSRHASRTTIDEMEM